jgi:ADP-ribosyl-[dinitrogen reductase] hydrolase
MGGRQMTISKEMRYKGCLVGLDVGDAVGTTVEFESPGSFPNVTDMIGGGPFNLEPGQWTDDTSMALCLAESNLKHPYGHFTGRQRSGRDACWLSTWEMMPTPKLLSMARSPAHITALQTFLNRGENNLHTSIF